MCLVSYPDPCLLHTNLAFINDALTQESLVLHGLFQLWQRVRSECMYTLHILLLCLEWVHCASRWDAFSYIHIIHHYRSLRRQKKNSTLVTVNQIQNSNFIQRRLPSRGLNQFSSCRFKRQKLFYFFVPHSKTCFPKYF